MANDTTALFDDGELIITNRDIKRKGNDMSIFLGADLDEIDKIEFSYRPLSIILAFLFSLPLLELTGLDNIFGIDLSFASIKSPSSYTEILYVIGLYYVFVYGIFVKRAQAITPKGTYVLGDGANPEKVRRIQAAFAIAKGERDLEKTTIEDIDVCSIGDHHLSHTELTSRYIKGYRWGFSRSGQQYAFPLTSVSAIDVENYNESYNNPILLLVSLFISPRLLVAKLKYGGSFCLGGADPAERKKLQTAFLNAKAALERTIPK